MVIDLDNPEAVGIATVHPNDLDALDPIASIRPHGLLEVGLYEDDRLVLAGRCPWNVVHAFIAYKLREDQ